MELIKYYDAPPQEVFEQIKEKSIEMWNTYDNTHWYVDEKVNRIKDLENVSDNAWYMVAMFDSSNQRKLVSKLEWQARDMTVRIMTWLWIDYN